MCNQRAILIQSCSTWFGDNTSSSLLRVSSSWFHHVNQMMSGGLRVGGGGRGVTRQLGYISSEERSISVRSAGNCTCDCFDSLPEKSPVSWTEYRPQTHSCVRKIKIIVHLFSYALTATVLNSLNNLTLNNSKSSILFSCLSLALIRPLDLTPILLSWS